MKKFRGMFRLLVLYLLREEPLHGYGLMQKMKSLFKGYSPSPGVVYPLLRELVKKGLVEVAIEEGRRGKKMYRITEEGLKFLEEHMGDAEKVYTHAKALGEFFELGGRELKEALTLTIKRIPMLSESQKIMLRNVLKKFTQEVRRVVEVE